MAEHVSCVIPTHRRPGLLAEALGSVADQTVRPGEVVVVDDARVPATADVCRATASSTGLDVRYVAGRHAGASASRNAGIAAARGEVIALLDDDDLWADGFLEQALERLVLGVDAVVAWIMIFREGLVAPGHSLARDVRAQDAVATNPGVTGSNLVVRRSAIEAVGGFDEELMASNDKDLWFRLLRSGITYDVVDQRLVYQRTHTVTRRIATSDPRKVGALLRYREKHAEHLDARGQRRLRRLTARSQMRFAETWWERASATLRFAAAGGLVQPRITPSVWVAPPPGAPAAVAGGREAAQHRA